MAKTIGQLAAIISANVTAFNAGLDQAEAKARSFAANTNASLNSAGGAGGFNAGVAAAVRKSAEDLEFVNQQVAHVAKGVQYNGNSIGANFGTMAVAASSASTSIEGGFARQFGAFKRLTGQVAGGIATFAGFFALGQQIGKMLHDNAAATEEWIKAIQSESPEARLRAISEELESLQNANQSGAMTTISNWAQFQTDAHVAGKIAALEREREVARIAADKKQAEREKAKRDEELKAYQEHMKQKEAVHRQIVDQINAEGIAAEENMVERLKLQRSVEIDRIERQFAGKELDGAMGQLIRAVNRRFEKEIAEAGIRTSDISDMMGDDADGAKAKPREAMEFKNPSLILAGSARAQSFGSDSLMAQLNRDQKAQADRDRQQIQELRKISTNTERLGGAPVVIDAGG